MAIRVLVPGASFAVNAARVFVAAIAAACVMWVAIGLVSLRFDIGSLPTLLDLLWSQLLIFGIMAAVFVNTYVMREYEDKGIGGPRWLRYLPAAWAALMSVGMAMLIVQIWTDYKAGPNFVLKIMYSLICVGGCGTYAGLISLVRIEPNPVYNALRYAMYGLSFLVGVETLDAIWTVPYLSSDDTGARFGWVAMAAGATAAAFGVIGLVVHEVSHKQERSRVVGMIAYAALGLVGFSLAVLALWDALEAGAMRFVLGAAVTLTIATVALWMLRNFYANPVVDEGDEWALASGTDETGGSEGDVNEAEVGDDVGAGDGEGDGSDAEEGATGRDRG